MIRPPLMLPTDFGSLILVTWRDAYFDFDNPDEQRDDYLVRTTGFLVKMDEKFLSLAAEELPDDDGYRAVTHIPRDMVIAISPLHEVTQE